MPSSRDYSKNLCNKVLSCFSATWSHTTVSGYDVLNLSRNSVTRTFPPRFIFSSSKPGNIISFSSHYPLQYSPLLTRGLEFLVVLVNPFHEFPCLWPVSIYLINRPLLPEPDLILINWQIYDVRQFPFTFISIVYFSRRNYVYSIVPVGLLNKLVVVCYWDR